MPHHAKILIIPFSAAPPFWAARKQGDAFFEGIRPPSVPMPMYTAQILQFFLFFRFIPGKPQYSMMSLFRKITALTALFTAIPVCAYADLYRYETKDGEVILTSQPRKDLKLIEVIRETKPAQKAAPTPQNSYSSRPAAADRSHQYDAFIQEASHLYNIPEAFIRAVIKIESNFNPQAVSRAGAMGLMQLMPATAAHMRVDDPFDPRQNIMGGTRYLRRLSDRYDGDINLVLSGYHAGPGNVEKVGGIPFEKTQQYVRNVYAWYVKYRTETKD